MTKAFRRVISGAANDYRKHDYWARRETRSRSSWWIIPAVLIGAWLWFSFGVFVWSLLFWGKSS